MAEVEPGAVGRALVAADDIHVATKLARALSVAAESNLYTTAPGPARAEEVELEAQRIRRGLELKALLEHPAPGVHQQAGQDHGEVSQEAQKRSREQADQARRMAHQRSLQREHSSQREGERLDRSLGR
jgi:hypothetical protein